MNVAVDIYKTDNAFFGKPRKPPGRLAKMVKMIFDGDFIRKKYRVVAPNNFFVPILADRSQKELKISDFGGKFGSIFWPYGVSVKRK